MRKRRTEKTNPKVEGNVDNLEADRRYVVAIANFICRKAVLKAAGIDVEELIKPKKPVRRRNHHTG